MNNKMMVTKAIMSNAATAYEKVYMDNSLKTVFSKTLKGAAVGAAIATTINVVGNISCEAVQRYKLNKLRKENPEAAERYEKDMYHPDYVEIGQNAVASAILGAGLALASNVITYATGCCVHGHRAGK